MQSHTTIDMDMACCTHGCALEFESDRVEDGSQISDEHLASAICKISAVHMPC